MNARAIVVSALAVAALVVGGKYFFDLSWESALVLAPVFVLTVGGIEDARSNLGRYVVRHWERIALVEGESLVYWLRKLVFRGAWLDHRVKEGLLEVAWDDDAADFGYRDPHGGRALLELAPVPSWHELQFRR